MCDTFDLTEARNNLVAKDNRLIQNSRYSLGLVENKAILYLISKIQPTDLPNKVYQFNCKEFQLLINWNSEASYSNVKTMLTKLSDTRWWIEISPEEEALVRWFNIVHMNKGTGNIEISFHEDMFPFLLDLQRHMEDNKQYFTSYRFQNVALMKHRYGPRLYEILKSYQTNNKKWTFENHTGSTFDLQRRIADTEIGKDDKISISNIPEGWGNWAVFKRDVLDPAVKEINKYTDIKVAYEGRKEDIHHRRTRAVRSIEFYMVGKTTLEQEETNQIIDGEYEILNDEATYHQMSIAEMFFQDHEKSLAIDRKAREAFTRDQEIKEQKDKYPAFYGTLIDERQAPLTTEQLELLYNAALTQRVAGYLPHTSWELYATDLVVHYYDEIAATPEQTKTSLFNRLLDCIKKDYDSEGSRLLQQYGGTD